MRFGYQEQSKRYESQDPVGSPKQTPCEHSHNLSLTVLFTTLSDTLSALRKATCLADQLGACVRSLVFHVVPFPSPIDEPRINSESRLRSFCEQEKIEVRIDIRLCRDASACIHEALFPQSLILIGGRQSWWPLTAEKRLANKLRKAGHQVVFVSLSS